METDEELHNDDDEDDIDSADRFQELKVLFPLKLMNKKLEINNFEVIGFSLFCLILNDFHKNRSNEFKYKVWFNIFDLNRDDLICKLDLTTYFTIMFKDHELENKEKVIQNMVESVLKEFSETDQDFKIDFNNFQKIAWASNFMGNITFEP